jgi:hypothetical protein
VPHRAVGNVLGAGQVNGIAFPVVNALFGAKGEMDYGVNPVLLNQWPQGGVPDVHGLHHRFRKLTAADAVNADAVNAPLDESVHHSFPDVACGAGDEDHCSLPFLVIVIGAETQDALIVSLALHDPARGCSVML